MAWARHLYLWDFITSAEPRFSAIHGGICGHRRELPAANPIFRFCTGRSGHVDKQIIMKYQKNIYTISEIANF
jgi:hypothetical protein